MAATGGSGHKDDYLVVDEEHVSKLYEEIRQGRNNESLDSTFLKRVCLAGTAALKILSHGQAGIIDGIKDPERGMPLEVMGVLSGHLSPSKDTLIITDAFPVPAKGGAHSVQEDPRTSGYMFDIRDEIEKMQPGDRLCGWYHSHPFDPNDAEYGHCWFSETDVQTQNQWQMMFEMGAGIPFVGIVVDPMNSLQRNQLMMAAFRNYPPSYDGAQKSGRCPDGKTVADSTHRHELWGQAWASYYRLELELFTTSLMAHVMQVIQKDAMWAAVLSQSKLSDPAFQRLFPSRIDKLLTEVTKTQSSISKRVPISADQFADIDQYGDQPAPVSRSAKRFVGEIKDSEISKIAKASDFIASDFAHAQLTQHCKAFLF